METRNANDYYEDRFVYPGEYTLPSNWLRVLNEELRKPHEGAEKPCVNISEFPDHYRIEIAAPGMKREDFYVQVSDRILSIYGLHNDADEEDEQLFAVHGFNYDCFSRDILLPKNIDTDFISAEYRNGVLHINFPKTNCPSPNRVAHIIVY